MTSDVPRYTTSSWFRAGQYSGFIHFLFAFCHYFIDIIFLLGGIRFHEGRESKWLRRVIRGLLFGGKSRLFVPKRKGACDEFDIEIVEAAQQRVPLSPCPSSAPFLEACVNAAKMVSLMYNYEDKRGLGLLQDHMKSLTCDHETF